MNSAKLYGRLTKDVELRETSTGRKVSTFSLATKRTYKDQNGEYGVDFHNIVVWNRGEKGKQAENCAKYLRKGSECIIEGRIETRSYEAKDGSKRYITEIKADNVTFVGGGNQSDTGASQGATDTQMLEINSEMPF